MFKMKAHKSVKEGSIWVRNPVDKLTWKIQIVRLIGSDVYHKIIEYNGELRDTYVNDPMDINTLLDAYEEER